MIGYKGFNHDFTCRDFQYEVGKEYETDSAVCCESGFHFCENPFDVFTYYPPSGNGKLRRYAEVEGSGEKDSDGQKISCTHIGIKAEIGLGGIINAGVKFILDKVKWDSDSNTNTGNYSAATNTGDYSAATNTGNWSAATNTGNYSAAINTGDYSAAINTGSRSSSTVEGKDSVAIVTGKDSKAKGSLGSWIVLTERGEYDGVVYPIINVKAFKVDNVKIKENTFYKLINGKPYECE